MTEKEIFIWIRRHQAMIIFYEKFMNAENVWRVSYPIVCKVGDASSIRMHATGQHENVIEAIKLAELDEVNQKEYWNAKQEGQTPEASR